MSHPTKDKEGDEAMMDADAPINSHGLTDNCYYVTAARLSKMTTDQLIKKTEEMQIAGGAPEVADIQSLFRSADLPATVTTRTTVLAIEQAVAALGATSDVLYGLAFRRGNGSGHMVVLHYAPLIPAIRYIDYQVAAHGANAAADVATGVQFHLFH